MGKEDGTEMAEIYALSRMDATLKRAQNSQIVLMYERLSAGKKVIATIYGQNIKTAIQLQKTEAKISVQLQEMADHMEQTQLALQVIEDSRLYQNMLPALQKKMKQMSELSHSIQIILEENELLHKQLKNMSDEMEKLTEDRLYMLDNCFFQEQMDAAILCHKEWMKALKKYIDTGREQLFSRQNQFYGLDIYMDAIRPKHREVVDLWLEITQRNLQIISFAEEIVQCMADRKREEARILYEQIKQQSVLILSQFEVISKRLKIIEKKKENVFER